MANVVNYDQQVYLLGHWMRSNVIAVQKELANDKPDYNTLWNTVGTQLFSEFGVQDYHKITTEILDSWEVEVPSKPLTMKQVVHALHGCLDYCKEMVESSDGEIELVGEGKKQQLAVLDDLKTAINTHLGFAVVEEEEANAITDFYRYLKGDAVEEIMNSVGSDGPQMKVSICGKELEIDCHADNYDSFVTFIESVMVERA